MALGAVLAGFGVKAANAKKVEEHESALAAYKSMSDSDRRWSTRPSLDRDSMPPAGGVFGIAALVAALAAGAFFGSATYKQDEGNANVLRSFTGQVVGIDEKPGLSMKAPWVKAIEFDVRNNLLTYENINFTDKNGTPGNLSLKVTYSLKSDKVDAIYREYKTQEKFERELIANDVAATVRQVPGKYSNVELLANREQVSNDILAALDKRWGDAWGVTGLQVALGDITYSEKVMERLENLTAEQTRADEAQAATRTAEELAKQKVAQAKGEAESNRELERSLTPAVLENRRIEMLKSVGEKGNLIITDGKSAPLINIDKKAGN